jgi:hypothetical protein
VRYAVACAALAACSYQPSVVPGGDATLEPDAPDDPVIDAPPDAPDSLLDGLVAWYEMETLVSGAIVDSSGNGHGGTCQSCPGVISNGKRGSAFQFSGAQRIDIGETAALVTANALSVAFWVQFATLPGTGFACAVGKGQNTGVFNTWQLCYDAAQLAWMFGSQPPAGGYNFLRSTPGPNRDVWHHVVLWWDGATKQLFIDGALRVMNVQNDVLFDGTPIVIGADIDNAQQAHGVVGLLDDVRIYNRTLTTDEIARLAAP